MLRDFHVKPRGCGRRTAVRGLLAVLAGLALVPWPAAAEPGSAYIALVMDDLGYRLKEGRETVALPRAVTLGFLPHTPHTPALAAAAVAEGHEIMLHMPMEARSGKTLGPGGLTAAMARADLMGTFRQALDSLPAVAGVSNHMGSLLTTRAAPMGWLMEAMGDYPGLYFVDSRTAGASVAAAAARDHGIPHYTRDVFLDDDPSPEAIELQLARLEHKARTRGMALGIGHPYPATLDALNAWLPALDERGIELVPVSRLIELRQHRRLANFEF
ncbi:MAG: divergent polysaccharide deacetylase family protein [Gammaproteobacteria bacterium]|nr:divergent polysaccharide deacetylase family protein [Gammaproteobacteria bacterium]